MVKSLSLTSQWDNFDFVATKFLLCLQFWLAIDLHFDQEQWEKSTSGNGKDYITLMAMFVSMHLLLNEYIMVCTALLQQYYSKSECFSVHI